MKYLMSDTSSVCLTMENMNINQSYVNPRYKSFFSTQNSKNSARLVKHYFV